MIRLSILFHALLAFSFTCLVSGCASYGNGVRAYVAPHTLSASELRKRPFESNRGFFVAKPDPPHDMEYVDFMLIIQNDTAQDMFFYEERNSFGYNSISLQIRTNGKLYQLTKKVGVWHRNIPTKIIVPAHTYLICPVSLDAGVWDNVPEMEIGAEFEIMATMQNGFVSRDGDIAPAQPRIISTPWTSITFREPQTVFLPGNGTKKQ